MLRVASAPWGPFRKLASRPALSARSPAAAGVSGAGPGTASSVREPQRGRKSLLLHHFSPPLAPSDGDWWRQAGRRAQHRVVAGLCPGWVPRCPGRFWSHVHLPEEPRPRHPGGWGGPETGPCDPFLGGGLPSASPLKCCQWQYK